MKAKDVEEFKKELGELLEKYHVRISFACSDSSDTSGLHKDSLVIVDRYTGKEIYRADSWHILAKDFIDDEE